MPCCAWYNRLVAKRVYQFLFSFSLMELDSHLLECFPEQVMNIHGAFESLTTKGLVQNYPSTTGKCTAVILTQKGERRQPNEPQPVCKPRHQSCHKSESLDREGVLKL